jgi:hypothetical protein
MADIEHFCHGRHVPKKGDGDRSVGRGQREDEFLKSNTLKQSAGWRR